MNRIEGCVQQDSKEELRCLGSSWCDFALDLEYLPIDSSQRRDYFEHCCPPSWEIIGELVSNDLGGGPEFQREADELWSWLCDVDEARETRSQAMAAEAEGLRQRALGDDGHEGLVSSDVNGTGPLYEALRLCAKSFDDEIAYVTGRLIMPRYEAMWRRHQDNVEIAKHLKLLAMSHSGTGYFFVDQFPFMFELAWGAELERKQTLREWKQKLDEVIDLMEGQTQEHFLSILRGVHQTP